ncbi:hypothetical protein SAMN02910456_00597 [Ruminococcaceae bacterium YRB3002]|nr:hypothetical protein SAMN02910456_00597 [Ruminococcaceae bacterium YRB3002]
MDSGLIVTGLYWCNLIIRAASILTVMVMGILIVLSRIKPAKVLGLGYIITSLSALSIYSSSIILHYVPEEHISMIQTAVSVFGALCSCGISICICLYLHRNYGSRKIYYPVLIIPVVSFVLSALTVRIFNRVIGTMYSDTLIISMIQTLISFAGSAAVGVIIIRVFYKNRHKEKIIPDMWILRIITIFWNCVTAVYTVMSYLMIIRYSKVFNEEEVNTLALFWIKNQDSIGLVAGIIGAVIGVIIPVYVFRRVRRLSPPEMV